VSARARARRQTPAGAGFCPTLTTLRLLPYYGRVARQRAWLSRAGGAGAAGGERLALRRSGVRRARRRAPETAWPRAMRGLDAPAPGDLGRGGLRRGFCQFLMCERLTPGISGVQGTRKACLCAGLSPVLCLGCRAACMAAIVARVQMRAAAAAAASPPALD